MATGNCYCLGINSNDFLKAFILGLNVAKVTAYIVFPMALMIKVTRANPAPNSDYFINNKAWFDLENLNKENDEL